MTENSSPRRKGAQAVRPSRIQQRNRRRILEAALEVFSREGFRGATLDQIAAEAGLSKPNMLYYFSGKEEIHLTLLDGLLDAWLAPLHELDPEGEPLEELLAYIRRKMEMTREMPRESRLFANEILQGAPRLKEHLRQGLKPLFDEKCALIGQWIDEGRLAPIDPRHLVMSIWAVTQHYADFDAQVQVLVPGGEGAEEFVETMFRRVLSPRPG